MSLTITEGGYYQDPKLARWISGMQTLCDAIHPESPKTAFGAIVAALKLRRDHGIKPFGCLCCDNLQENGAILRQVIVEMASLSDPELAGWIDNYSAFSNSMVDCIVPATGMGTKISARSRVMNAVPVTHEDFRQWKVNNFCMGRPIGNW